MPRLPLLAVPAVGSALALELGRAIEYHARIGSTQTRARELAADGAGAMVIVADEQTAGEGTKGRSWLAPGGTSLLASWILRPAPVSPAVFVGLAGVAVARALATLGLEHARLKWPNDVEVEGRKIAGALAHATSDGEGGVLVLGIGVNVHQRASDLAPELRDIATSCAIAGHDIDRLALLARVTRELDRLAAVDERRRAMDEWRSRSTVLGQPVRVDASGRAAFTGVADAIDDDGALLVTAEGRTHRVIAGDVRLA